MLVLTDTGTADLDSDLQALLKGETEGPRRVHLNNDRVTRVTREPHLVISLVFLIVVLPCFSSQYSTFLSSPRAGSCDAHCECPLPPSLHPFAKLKRFSPCSRNILGGMVANLLPCLPKNKTYNCALSAVWCAQACDGRGLCGPSAGASSKACSG